MSGPMASPPMRACQPAVSRSTKQREIKAMSLGAGGDPAECPVHVVDQFIEILASEMTQRSSIRQDSDEDDGKIAGIEPDLFPQQHGNGGGIELRVATGEVTLALDPTSLSQLDGATGPR